MWSALFVCAIALNLCVCSVGQTLSSGTPLYVQKMGGTHFFSGLLVSVYIVSAMFGRIIGGRLADNRSRRFVMLAGSCTLIVGSFLPVFIPHESMMFASKVMQGLGFATAQTAIGAFAADSLPLKRLGEGIGFFGLGQAVAMALGPALSVWLVSLQYSDALSVGIGCLGLIMLVISFFIRYEKNPVQLPHEASYRLVWERRKALREKAAADSAGVPPSGAPSAKATGTGAEGAEMAVATTTAEAVGSTSQREKNVLVGIDPGHDGAMQGVPGWLLGLFDRYFERSARYGAVPALFFSATAAVFVSYTTAFALDSGYASPSFFFVLAAIAAIALRLTISKAMDSFNSVRLFAAALGCGGISLAVMMLVHNEVAFYLCGIGYGICIGIAMPLMNSTCVKASPQERYGAANGLFFFSYDIGFGAGVVVWGLIIDLLGYNAIFVGGMACLAAALLFAIRLFPKVH